MHVGRGEAAREADGGGAVRVGQELREVRSVDRLQGARDVA